MVGVGSFASDRVRVRPVLVTVTVADKWTVPDSVFVGEIMKVGETGNVAVKVKVEVGLNVRENVKVSSGRIEIELSGDTVVDVSMEEEEEL